MKDMCERIHAGLSDCLASEIGLHIPKLNNLCESPIEVMLGCSLLLYDRVIGCIPFSPLIISKQGEEESHYGPDCRLLIPQYNFENYRIDWVFKDAPVIAFIECDGHDFHERTKEQAARDRQRDRAVQQAGYHILRFTGSEIYKDATGCAAQIFDFVSEQHMYHHLRRA